MSFTLVIISGKGEGKKFSFTKSEVSVGRLPDNDLVLYDTGVSRKHCKIVQTSPTQHMLVDNGSANGTRVNGDFANELELADGDLIEVGPVSFNFETGDTQPGVENGKRQLNRPENTEARQQMEHLKTEALNLQQVEGIKELQEEMRGRMNKGRKPQKANDEAEEEQEESPQKSRSSRRRRKQREDKKKAEQEAAEQEAAEQENQQYTEAHQKVGKFKLWWLRQSSGTRKLLVVMLLLIVLSAGGVAIFLFAPTGAMRADYSDKIFDITSETSKKSYGYGRVSVQCHDKVNFRFNYSNGLAMLHYTVGGADSPNEIAIYLNGKLAGYTPLAPNWVPDIKFKLPRKLLKPQAPNILTFDNTRNPPGSERWGIARVEVEQTALPPPDPQKAMEKYMKGQNYYRNRMVDPANLSKAIEDFNDAMLFLESLDPKPPLYQQIKVELKNAENALKIIYDDKVFQAYTAERAGNYELARKVYTDILRYLPNVEDERHQEVLEHLKRLGQK